MEYITISNDLIGLKCFAVIERCKTTPNVPRNGALACDTWLGGKYCQMQCKEGYDVRPGFPFHELLVCSVEGEWTPPNVLPLSDCTSKRFLIH